MNSIWLLSVHHNIYRWEYCTGLVKNLNEDLSRKAKVLEDDASFLLEVKEDQSAATPDMNPDKELEALKLRFAKFQHEFKV